MSILNEVIFASKLILLLEKASTESVIFSPASILTELAILYISAKEKTAEEIAQIIGEDMTKKDMIELFSHLVNQYKKTSETKTSVEVTFANKLFISRNCNVVTEIIDQIKTSMNGIIEYVDFSAKTTVMTGINNFIKTSTNQQINTVINEEDVNSSTDFIIINTVHFIASWNDNFNKNHTCKKTFNSIPSRDIKMMNKTVTSRLKWNLVENEKWVSLGIPYENYEAWLFIVLPNKNCSLSELLNTMNLNNFNEWTKRDEKIFERYNKLDITLPLVNVSSNLMLKEILKVMGMKDAFTSNSNFENIVQRSGMLNEIMHASVIRIDEEGTEASSVSRGQRIPTSASQYIFIADRPFLYFITTSDETTFFNNNTIEIYDLLFMGTFC